ncbi:MAG TPA: gliding motility-associated C-terminal domain-containing protein [Bacteroidales bacterium]|nr:gliding motility-associated C-terminal domain-containing protein [Bacteroidales bacterium]HRZ47933.1 gliding motility-associated C-terminal domain-containing protein [Bacteroidales bacterium]
MLRYLLVFTAFLLQVAGLKGQVIPNSLPGALNDTLICAGSSVTLVSPGLTSQTLYTEDFENPLPGGWSDTSRFFFYNSMKSGPFSNQQLLLNLINLSVHDSILVSFDLYIHDSWQGWGPAWGPDFYYQIIDGDTVLITTFDNTSTGYQAYPDFFPAVHPPGTGSIATLPYRCITGDVTRLYQLNFKKAHNASSTSIGFSGAPDQNICDESWSIDDVKIELTNVPNTNLQYLWSTNDTTPSITVLPVQTTTYSVIVTNGVDTLYDTCTVYIAPSGAGPDASICPGDSTILMAAAGAQSYLWSPSAGLSSDTSATPTASPLSSTIYSLNTYYQIAGMTKTCYDSVMITVFSLPQPQLGNDISVCTGSPVTLGPGSGYSSYLWSTSDTTQVLGVIQSGTYWVEVTDTNGCLGIDSIGVTFIPYPQVTMQPAVDTVCQGSPVIIRALANLSPVVYNWSTGSVGDSSVVSPVSTSTYKVTVSYQGCLVIDSSVIHTKYKPDPYIYTTKYNFCDGDSATLQAVSLYAPFTLYQWSTGQTGQTIHIFPSVSTTYTVTATYNGCVGDTSLQIEVKPIPQISVIASPQMVCLGDTTKLTALSDIWGTTFTWTTGHTGTQILITPTVSGQIKVTGTVNGCSSSDSITLTIKQVPTVQLQVNGQNPLCAGDSVVLSATSNMSTASFLWSTAVFTPQITVTPVITTTYTVTATVSGCYSDTSVVISVNPSPQLTVSPANIELCDGESVLIDVVSDMAGTVFSWSNGMTGTPITITPAAPFTLTLTGTAAGCTTTLSLPVDVIPMPTVSLGEDGYVCEGEPVTLTPAGSFQSVEWWDGGTQPTHQVFDPGTYWIIAYNGKCGVADSVFFDECPHLKVPNVFTPNGDGFNDIFRPEFTSVEVRSFMVFTRWGSLVFSSQETAPQWDGTHLGFPCAEGVYYYVVRYFNPKFGLVQEKAGAVQLLR